MMEVADQLIGMSAQANSCHRSLPFKKNRSGTAFASLRSQSLPSYHAGSVRVIASAVSQRAKSNNSWPPALACGEERICSHDGVAADKCARLANVRPQFLFASRQAALLTFIQPLFVPEM
jgi:hypothetical protein